MKKTVTIDYRSEFTIDTNTLKDDVDDPPNHDNIAKYITQRLAEDPRYFDNNLEVVKVKVEHRGSPKDTYEANKTGQADKTTIPGGKVQTLSGTGQKVADKPSTLTMPKEPAATPAAASPPAAAKTPTPTPTAKPKT